MKNQFTAKRIVLLTIVFGLMFVWIAYMVNVVGVKGDVGFDDASAWDPYVGAAWISVVIVIIADVLATIAAFRHSRNVKGKEEKATAERIARLKAAGFNPATMASNPLERAIAKGSQKGGASA